MSTYLSNPYLYDEERYFVSSATQIKTHEKQQNTMISGNTLVNVEQEKKIVELELQVKNLEDKITSLTTILETFSGFTEVNEIATKLNQIEEVTSSLQEDMSILTQHIQTDENGVEYLIADDVRLKESSEYSLYPHDSEHEDVVLTDNMAYTTVVEKLANAIYDLNDTTDGEKFV